MIFVIDMIMIIKKVNDMQNQGNYTNQINHSSDD